MSKSRPGRRRSLAARSFRFVWRVLRVALIAFCALGPAPPPPLPARIDPTEQTDDSGQELEAR